MKHLVLPSGAVLVWPPVVCPECRRVAAMIVTTARGSRCSTCARPEETIGGVK